MLRALAPASALALLILAACGNGGTGTGTGTGTGGTGSGSGGNGGSSSAPITDCKTINSTGCFSNDDCTSAADRCQNKGTTDAPVACCVPGARGAGQSGAACKTENDCATAVCVYESSGGGGGAGGASADAMYCSPPCTTDADCPSVLPTCFTLNTGVGKGAFCGPAS